MDSTFYIDIAVPTDDDGYVLLKCPNCGQYFSAPSSDIESDTVLFVHCPHCGLTGDTFVTDDVVDLAKAMAQNKAMDLIHAEMKKMERQFRHGLVSFNAGPRPDHIPEEPLYAWINEMVEVSFPCCHRTAKVRPLLKMTGCHCIYCGVMNFEFE